MGPGCATSVLGSAGRLRAPGACDEEELSGSVADASRTQSKHADGCGYAWPQPRRRGYQAARALSVGTAWLLTSDLRRPDVRRDLTRERFEESLQVRALFPRKEIKHMDLLVEMGIRVPPSDVEVDGVLDGFPAAVVKIGGG